MTSQISTSLLRYSDQDQLSFGHCYIKHATNGMSPRSILGHRIEGATNDILNESLYQHCSFGTGNCDLCHVPINYRSLLLDGERPGDRGDEEDVCGSVRAGFRISSAPR